MCVWKRGKTCAADLSEANAGFLQQGVCVSSVHLYLPKPFATLSLSLTSTQSSLSVCGAPVRRTHYIVDDTFPLPAEQNE